MQWKRTPTALVCGMVVLLLMTFVLPASLDAQETRGRITGRVTDASKAIVPGATVTVTDLSRNTTVTAVTNEQGLFQANYLLPGTYRVTVELQGFKKWIQENVPLQMTETRDLTIVLEVGGLQESVNVSAATPLVNTSDASLGLVVDQARLASLPLIHGDPYKIMGLATGVSHINSQRLDRPFEPTHIIGYAYDGTRSNRSDLLIDGAPSTATANAYEVIATYVPPSDLVQEFKVQTATFDAQFGNTEGGVTSISIKSGTNRLRGTAYYFAEPYKLGANDFFGKARGQAMIQSNSNRPGFTVGGPVIIPKLYNGKDKTFFMFGYERITDKRPRFDAGASVWVPTDKLRNGDFSDYSSNITIYDPLTRTGTTTFIGQPFAGNVIPANRINPAAKKILEDYYSLPKSPGLVGNIYDSTLPELTDPYYTLTGRIDQKVSNSNRMFARYSYYYRNSTYNDYLNSLATHTMFQFVSYQAVVDDVHVFNPTTVLNVRYGYNRFDRISGYRDEVYGFDQTKLGFPAAYNGLVKEADRLFPRLDFTGGMLGTGVGGDRRPVTSHTGSITLNKSMGAHALKAGAEMRQYGERNNAPGNNQTGQYAFTNTYTRQSSASGTDYNGLQAYASFLLGMPSTTSITRPATYDEYSRTWGFYVQDDWRVNSKLTLNIGLRYELETPLVEKDNKTVTGFDYDYVQPIQTAAQAGYALRNDPDLKALVPQISVTGGLRFAGVDDKKLYNTPKNTFLPRLGFAYKLADKTVIRGGAGLFAGFLGERRGDVSQPGFSQTTTAGTTFNAFGAPIPLYWDTAWLTTPIMEPVGNAQGRQTSLGQGITFFIPNPKISKQLRWQIGFQRELPGSMTVEAMYVGNYGFDIEINRNINALPNKYLNTDNSRSAAMDANNTFLSASGTNPFAGLLPGTSFNNPTIGRSQLMRPYPAFGDITGTNNDGKTWYNSGQFGLQKRFSQGYTIGLSYTLSKWMQATEYLNADDPSPTKMISDQDVTHRLSASTVIELPFGRGRRFLSDASGIADALIGGWQLQGVFTYQTGLPVGFSDCFYNGTDPVNGKDIKIDHPTTQKWFNTDVFTSILNSTSTLSTPVNHLRTFPIRFSAVRRDSINNVDLSLIKNTKLRGGVALQLRAEFINALNEPYFPAPVTGVTSSDFGKVTASNQDNYARRAQLGVKITF
jgi:hypothetical protein